MPMEIPSDYPDTLMKSEKSRDWAFHVFWGKERRERLTSFFSKAALEFWRVAFSFVGSRLECLAFQRTLTCAPAEPAFFPGNSE